MMTTPSNSGKVDEKGHMDWVLEWIRGWEKERMD
jgi:hypothetical protein